MLARTDLRSHPLSPAGLRAVLPRAEVDVDAVTSQVAPLIDVAREWGVEAVLELTERLDGVRPASAPVPAVPRSAGPDACR